jgi:hypothetical protein
LTLLLLLLNTQQTFSDCVLEREKKSRLTLNLYRKTSSDERISLLGKNKKEIEKPKREKVAQKTQNICVIIGPAQRVREPSRSLFFSLLLAFSRCCCFYLLFLHRHFLSFFLPPTSFHHPRLLYVVLRH